MDGEADSKPTRNLSGYCPQAVRETFRTKRQENRNPTGRLTTAIAPTCGTKAPAPPESARLQALFDKKDYAGVIASAEEAAAVQTDEEERSDVYFILGAAYNARTMPQQAIDALSKVTAGANVAAAQKTVAQLKENAAKANS